MDEAVLELDLHGCTVYQAEIAIDAALRRAKAGTYRIRVIHGSRSGTALRNMVRSRYSSHPRILRLEVGLNPSQTDLVLREYSSN